MEKISTSELIAKVSADTGITQNAVKLVIASTSHQIVAHVVNHVAVTVKGLGTFKPVDRAARTCRNPATGANMEVSAKRSLGFKAEAGNKELATSNMK